MTLREAFQAGEYILTKANIPNPDYDAWELLEKASGRNKTHYFLYPEEELSIEAKTEYRNMLLKRVEHVPLQYITGEQCFMGYMFKVNSSVLIPRQDTEILVQEVDKICHAKQSILDMCTGSGCIITTLKAMNPEIIATGVDISKAAVNLAKENARNNHVEVEFICSDLFDKVFGSYDIIVSNPPYIPSEVIQTLDVEVREYEPYEALNGMEDGLYFYRLIIEKSKNYLKDAGYLCFEIGYDQAESVSAILKEHGFVHIAVKKDLAGLDRVVIAQKG